MGIELRIKNELLKKYPNDVAIQHLTQMQIRKVIGIHNNNITFHLRRYRTVPLGLRFYLRRKRDPAET